MSDLLYRRFRQYVYEKNNEHDGKFYESSGTLIYEIEKELLDWKVLTQIRFPEKQAIQILYRYKYLEIVNEDSKVYFALNLLNSMEELIEKFYYSDNYIHANVYLFPENDKYDVSLIFYMVNAMWSATTKVIHEIIETAVEADSKNNSKYCKTSSNTNSNSDSSKDNYGTEKLSAETNQSTEEQKTQTSEYEVNTEVIGVTFQQYLRQCKVGQELNLVRDKLNLYDKCAIAVYAGKNQVGFISPDIAEELASKMAKGKKYSCIVQSMTSGSKKIYRLNVKVMELVGVLGGHEKAIEDSKWEYEKGRFQQGVPNIATSVTLGKTFYTLDCQHFFRPLFCGLIFDMPPVSSNPMTNEFLRCCTN